MRRLSHHAIAKPELPHFRPKHRTAAASVQRKAQGGVGGCAAVPAAALAPAAPLRRFRFSTRSLICAAGSVHSRERDQPRGVNDREPFLARRARGATGNRQTRCEWRVRRLRPGVNGAVNADVNAGVKCDGARDGRVRCLVGCLGFLGGAHLGSRSRSLHAVGGESVVIVLGEGRGEKAVAVARPAREYGTQPPVTAEAQAGAPWRACT